jgi:hypothetical protein
VRQSQRRRFGLQIERDCRPTTLSAALPTSNNRSNAVACKHPKEAIVPVK